MAVKAGYVDFTGDTTLTFDWEPEGFICWAVSQPANGYLSNANFAGYTGDTGMSIGFADQAGQQCATVSSTQQGFAPFNNSGRAMRTDCVLVQSRGNDPGSSTDTVEATLTGNTVELVENGTVNMLIHYIAFAGDSMNIAAGTLTMPGDGSDYTETGLAFDPSIGNSLLICASTIDTAAAATGLLYFGMTDGDNAGRNVGLVIEYNDLGGRAGRTIGVIGGLGAGTVEFDSWTSDGFTLRQGGADDSQVIAWFLINDLDTLNASDNANEDWPTAPTSITTPGFPPGLAIFAGSIDGEEDIGGQITIGYAWDNNGTIVTAAALAGVANVDDQRRWTAISTDVGEVLIFYEGDTGTQTGSAEFDAFTSTGFDWDGYENIGVTRVIVGALGTGPAGLYPQIIRWT